MKKIFCIISLFTLLTLLNGCWESVATGALEGAIEQQERTNRIRSAANVVGFNQAEFKNLENKMDRVTSCIDTVERDPKYYPLDLKNPNKPTYKNLQDPSYITNEERKILAWYIGASEVCYDLFRHDTYQSPLVAEFQMIVDRAFLEAFSWYAELDNGGMTWGEFNREGERFQSRFEYRVEMWKNKVLSKTAEIANIVALQEEQIFIRRQREAYKKEFKKNRVELQRMKNENRRLQNQKRHLTRCSRYPGTYANCPN